MTHRLEQHIWTKNAKGMAYREEAFSVRKRKGNTKESNHGVIPTLIPLSG
jgi:hypothetical protein